MSPACSATFCALPKLHRDALTALCHPLMYWQDDQKKTFPTENPPLAEGGCCKSSECTVSTQSRAHLPPSYRNHHQVPCSQRSEHKSPRFPNSMLFRLMATFYLQITSISHAANWVNLWNSHIHSWQWDSITSHISELQEHWGGISKVQSPTPSKPNT